MGTMGMGIRRGLGELGPFLFVFRRRAPVFGIQVRGLGDIVFLRALLDGLPLVLRRRNLGLARLILVLCDGRQWTCRVRYLGAITQKAPWTPLTERPRPRKLVHAFSPMGTI